MYKHKDGVTLRKIERRDLSKLLALKQESWWGTHNTLLANLDDQQHWYDNMPTNQLCLIAEATLTHVPRNDCDTDPVGVALYTEIDWVARTLNISGSIYKEHRNTPIVKKAFAAGLDFAFEMLNMWRVGAEVLETNTAAQRLEIEYLGFEVEGRRRQSVFKCGRHYDSILLGILRPEWEKQHRVVTYRGVCNSNFHPRIIQEMGEV